LELRRHTMPFPLFHAGTWRQSISGWLVPSYACPAGQGAIYCGPHTPRPCHSSTLLLGSEWREGEGSPCTGKLSARTGRSAGIIFHIVQGAFATIPSPPLHHRPLKSMGAQFCVFEGISGIYQSDGGALNQTWTGPTASRQWSQPKPENASGGPRSPHRPDEFRPAIPRSGWSPPEPVSASPARTD
jgi:hypothetical protein